MLPDVDTEVDTEVVTQVAPPSATPAQGQVVVTGSTARRPLNLTDSPPCGETLPSESVA